MQGLDGPPFGMQRAIRVFLVPILVDMQPGLTGDSCTVGLCPVGKEMKVGRCQVSTVEIMYYVSV